MVEYVSRVTLDVENEGIIHVFNLLQCSTRKLSSLQHDASLTRDLQIVITNFILLVPVRRRRGKRRDKRSVEPSITPIAIRYASQPQQKMPNLDYP